jgi:hypothetical protein
VAGRCRQRVASVKEPTLVIVGSASPAWIHKSAMALADLLPEAQVRGNERITSSDRLEKDIDVNGHCRAYQGRH